MTLSTRARQRAVYEHITRFRHQRSGLGAPVRDAFFSHSRSGVTVYPLASLLSATGGSGGGRGGRTRVMLYLSLLWVAGGGDHSSSRPAKWWAELLGLEDPEGAGGRVIRSSWGELERRGFVSITRGEASGDIPTIRPLREDGSREAYTIPAGRGGDTYRRIPDSAWQALFHTKELTGPGLVMFLIALRTYGQSRGGSLTFPRDYFRSEYGISDSTRKTGLRNLVSLSVLEAEGTSVEQDGSGSRRRGRTVYELMPTYYPPERSTTGTSNAGEAS